MLALARVVAAELQTTAQLSRLNLIYARIDELEESVLDILAYDLHVDWYSYEYPLAAMGGNVFVKSISNIVSFIFNPSVYHIGSI